MNVASLELCKELYELSGWWESTENWYVPNNDAYKARHESVRGPENFEWQYPAYDLGYLLRKLPRRRPDDVFSGVQLMTVDDETWACRIAAPKHDFVWGVAGTPEDAAAKLAIELFKKGILNK